MSRHRESSFAAYAERCGAPVSPGVLPHFDPPQRQRGVALFISLALLLVLTIAGVSAVQTTSLEERMARNTHDQLLAFQAAESALREAEDWLTDNVTSTAVFQPSGADGLWSAPLYGQVLPRWRENVWDRSSNRSRGAIKPVQGVAAQPRFIVEWVATVDRNDNPNLLASSYSRTSDRVEIFRITARGVGATEDASVMLQGTFGMKL